MRETDKWTTLETQLDKDIQNNEGYCGRILMGRINEADAVYLAELTEQPALTDRELYIYHRAFSQGVKAVRAMMTDADTEAPRGRNMCEELFDAK